MFLLLLLLVMLLLLIQEGSEGGEGATPSMGPGEEYRGGEAGEPSSLPPQAGAGTTEVGEGEGPSMSTTPGGEVLVTTPGPGGEGRDTTLAAPRGEGRDTTISPLGEGRLTTLAPRGEEDSTTGPEPAAACQNNVCR